VRAFYGAALELGAESLHARPAALAGIPSRVPRCGAQS
jgi:hypothetical protein